MIGFVNSEFEAILPLELVRSDGSAVLVHAVIDTGFNGHVTVPSELVGTLGLIGRSSVEAMLGDGTMVTLMRHVGTIRWNGADRQVVVLETAGVPLIGMALLRGSRLSVDVAVDGAVRVEQL